MESCTYRARYLSYSTWLCAGDQVAGVAGTSLEHVPGALSRNHLCRVTLVDLWCTRLQMAGL